MTSGIPSHFTPLDWLVLVAYLLLTTWVGHALRGNQSTINDFFLAGRKMPWPAVCGSIIATEISALTFIGVPGMIFAANGDMTYLQWGLGSIIARFIVGIFFVKVFYERGIFSPYDYIQTRLGHGARLLTTSLFFLASVLGQSVRLLVTALILWTVTGLPFTACIILIGLFAILWTLIGGMTTVIWTDVIQFFIFVGGGLLALIILLANLPGGIPEFLHSASQACKFRILNLSTNPDAQFTLWVGLLAMPFQNLAAFGTDQLNAQRMFCCRTARQASLAIIFSSLSLLITFLMLLVGAALYVHYLNTPPTPSEQAFFQKDPDTVFPVWITTCLPPGLSGLILAGAFAAAISSLDSALAALSQTSLSLIHSRTGLENANQQALLRQSRIAIVAWGIALILTAIGLQAIRGQINLISLAFGMVSYTYGPLLGAFLLALSNAKASLKGVAIGTILSILLVAIIRPDLYNIATLLGILPTEAAESIRPKINFAWAYPITCLITFTSGLFFFKNQSPSKKSPPALQK